MKLIIKYAYHVILLNIVLHALEKKIIFYVQNVNMDLYYIIMSVKKKNA